MSKKIGLLVFAIIMGILSMGITIPTFAATNNNNVIYLPHGYFCTTKTDSFIASEVNALTALSFNYQMCNLAAFNSDGTMPAANYSTLSNWIRVSHNTNPNSKVIGYVNGTKTLADNVSAHQNMVDACVYLVNTLGCDGIHLDFEPVSADDTVYLSLMQKIKNAIGTKHLSVAAPMSNWSAAFITQVSSVVNQIDVMCYDTGSKTTESQYITLVKNAVSLYSGAISSGCELNPIQAAYKRSSYHNPSIENIINGSAAIDQAVANGASVFGSGVWWWYEMTDVDKTNWSTYWIR